MPYDELSDLPDAVQKMPKHAQEIYQSAFNSAWEQYKDRGKQREALAHATAWAAVEKSYEKKNGRWVAKTKEAIMAELSADEKKQKLQTALTDEYKLKVEDPIPSGVVIEEVYENELVYSIDSQAYKVTYEMDEDGKATFGEPEKVVAEKVYKPVEALSMENTRSVLQAALVSHLRLAKDEYVYIEDMTETDFIYSHDHQSYKATYSIAEDGAVTFGDPQKVTRVVTYKAMEALQSAYAELLQEVGRRNANLDSARIKKIVALCQELLSSEGEPDEKKAKEALKEAKSVLKWAKEQAVMKTEDGIKFPAAAYAYVPDKEKSTTWKLRLWEDLTKKVTRAQLGRAAAALSPGGFRGQKVAIPSADLSAVKRKIRAEYRKLDVEDEDISKWVKEAEGRKRLLSFEPLTEAKFDKGRATVIVIKPGFNATEDRYYPEEMLKRDYKIFEGMKMYADHPTETEEKELPERSIREWVATLKDVTCDDNGVVTGVADIIETWLMQKLATLRDKKMLSEMGISINAVGSASKATIDGKETLVIEKLVACRSVDFVTEPGAGGEVTLYESESNDIDLVELSALKERRPDLVKEIEADVRAIILKEAKKAMDDKERIAELETQNETLTTENEGLKTKVSEGEKATAKAEAQATIKEAVDKAELPDASKAVLLERFKDAESADGIEEAIQSEKDYVAKLAEAGKVRGLGPTKEELEAGQAALKESFKTAHPEWSDEQVETAVAGH